MSDRTLGFGEFHSFQIFNIAYLEIWLQEYLKYVNVF